MSNSDFRTPDAKKEADAAASRDERVTRAGVGTVDEDDLATADGLTPSPETAEHYREMTARGAQAKGEGRLP